eukprot:TRINITY_DN39798_c0_g1_i1.p1 TRINITY_DN39798_c0_g1~~TRINITY_DN39798_c0_g1_i1.p1  ORF type:complete len:254 (-),score=45.04 TRINITY_DN39798_c0_g1_i1:42-803(-)
MLSWQACFWFALFKAALAEIGGQTFMGHGKATTSKNVERALASDAFGKFHGARYVVKNSVDKAPSQKSPAAGVNAYAALPQMSESDRALMADALGKFRGARRVIKSGAAEPSAKSVPAMKRRQTRTKEDEALLSAYVTGKFRPAKYVLADSVIRPSLEAGAVERTIGQSNESPLMSNALGKVKGAKYIVKDDTRAFDEAGAIRNKATLAARERTNRKKRKLGMAEAALSFGLTNKYHGARYIFEEDNASDTLV